MLIKIAVAGIGYVGLSNAVLLVQYNTVTAVDLSEDRVAGLNARQSPIIDLEHDEYLAKKPLDLTATMDSDAAYARSPTQELPTARQHWRAFRG